MWTTKQTKKIVEKKPTWEKKPVNKLVTRSYQSIFRAKLNKTTEKNHDTVIFVGTAIVRAYRDQLIIMSHGNNN